MADEQLDEHFVELVSSVSHANGVFRITLGQQLEAGSARPVTRLLIPANQLQAVLRGIADGANEIREKLQSQSKDDGGKDAVAKKKPAAKK